MARPNVREQLLDAGLATFHSHGFNGCAVQDITNAAGVPKGSFYNHFESKEALALQSLERFWQNGEARRELLADTSIDPVERLRRHFQALLDALERQHFQRGCLIGNFSAELFQNTEIRERLASLYSSWTRALEQCVIEAEAAGRLRVQLPASDIASFLVNAWEGTVLRSKIEQNKGPLEQFERVTFASFFS